MQTSDLELIIKTAELGSITAAALALDMRLATASVAIKRVEQELGTELFVRSTRKLRLSAAGERFLPRCQEAVGILQRARTSLREDNDQIEGELRITVSSDFGRNVLVPWLDEILGRHPGLTLNITLSDALLDFYRTPVDVALRYGSPPDSNLTGFKICDVPCVLCASAEYLARMGRPKHPDHLVDHHGLVYQLRDTPHDTWAFHRREKTYKVKVPGRRITNDADLVRRWCVSGKGLAVKSILDMTEDLLAERVEVVMPDYQPKPTELWLICPSRQHITPAIRLLRDTIREKCAALMRSVKQAGLIDSLP